MNNMAVGDARRRHKKQPQVPRDGPDVQRLAEPEGRSSRDMHPPVSLTMFHSVELFVLLPVGAIVSMIPPVLACDPSFLVVDTCHLPLRKNVGGTGTFFARI